MNTRDAGSDTNAPDDRYLSTRDLAGRWSCSRTSAQRIAERAGFARYLLGQGRNGMVRYALAEIEAYERENRFGAE